MFELNSIGKTNFFNKRNRKSLLRLLLTINRVGEKAKRGEYGRYMLPHSIICIKSNPREETAEFIIWNREKLGRGAFGTVKPAVGRIILSDRQIEFLERAPSIVKIEQHLLGKGRHPLATLSALRESEIRTEVYEQDVATCSRLSTDNIAKYYTVMPYLGIPVTRYLRNKRINGKLIYMTFLKICIAVKQLHDAGYGHGDLKPANILVNGKGEISLIDLAGRFRLKEMRTEFATSGYAAPERYFREDFPAYSAAFDVFSLGVIFCVLGSFLYSKDEKICFTEAFKEHKIRLKLENMQQSYRKEEIIEDFTLFLHANITAIFSLLDTDISRVILKMVSPYPDKRPKLDQVIEHLDGFCR